MAADSNNARVRFIICPFPNMDYTYLRLGVQPTRNAEQKL